MKIVPIKSSKKHYAYSCLSCCFALAGVLLCNFNIKYWWIAYVLSLLFSVISLFVYTNNVIDFAVVEEFSNFFTEKKNMYANEIKGIFKESGLTIGGILKSVLGIIIVIVGVIGFFKACFGVNSYSNDGVCDRAGCSEKAVTSYGEHEWCLKHYLEMSNLPEHWKDN